MDVVKTLILRRDVVDLFVTFVSEAPVSRCYSLLRLVFSLTNYGHNSQRITQELHKQKRHHTESTRRSRSLAKHYYYYTYIHTVAVPKWQVCTTIHTSVCHKFINVSICCNLILNLTHTHTYTERKKITKKSFLRIVSARLRWDMKLSRLLKEIIS